MESIEKMEGFRLLKIVMLNNHTGRGRKKEESIYNDFQLPYKSQI